MLKIFNSINNKKEKFISIRKNKVNIYVCGVTVYDTCHIGHGRTFISFDMIIRYLIYLGYKINYVRNITDIDDKIINKSYKKKISIKKLTKNNILKMKKDFKNLNLLNPNKEPLVTNNIQNIIKLIIKLLKNNNAYISYNGDVLFSIKTYKQYGYFFKKKEYNNINNLDNKIDFVLWKKSNINEPGWLSPWGIGRPGWHIECSAIYNKYLGTKIDIHGGGQDLVFPHNENEIAQSQCAFKNNIINYWMHIGMLMIDNEKMSKSKKNDFKIKKMLNNYNNEIIRCFLLSRHYRKPLIYKNNSLIKYTNILRFMYKSLQNTNPNVKTLLGKTFKKRFFEAMNDDFNISESYSVLLSLSKEINILKKKQSSKVHNFAARLRQLGKILGLLNNNPDIFLKKIIKKPLQTKNKKKFYYKYIYKINKIRNYYRTNKNWKIADKMKNKLIKLNLKIEDNINNTILYKK
ncbi:Cysteine--tRNA ligase [Candidatus Annandia adelgestsuga]|uniref:Cysteine--tRNA ligase n=1 Tax=Candidatus Annandia adelgestsuga TaxID=1302411 RepID=A0A3Q9CLK7_9ENTR|nr:cysteine--tRNA ligase [Candidatus Annandia adelgestsuga]AZP36353.1 Cysteine--tRNA ligase [Candidatus Annandia adelgestsuga]